MTLLYLATFLMDNHEITAIESTYNFAHKLENVNVTDYNNQIVFHPNNKINTPATTRKINEVSDFSIRNSGRITNELAKILKEG